MANDEEPVENLFKIQSEADRAATVGKCMRQLLEDGGGLKWQQMSLASILRSSKQN